jgi:lysozyme family protein
MNFETAIKYVIDQEGAFTDDKDDSGNWTTGKIGKGELKGTKYGISAASYPKVDIKNLTKDQAFAIYRRDYWNEISADRLPAKIRLHVLDFAINAGVGAAKKLLQKVIGVKEDGNFGDKTMAQIHNVTPWQYAMARVDYYDKIVDKAPIKQKYFAGWMKRNLSITETCVNLP